MKTAEQVLQSLLIAQITGVLSSLRSLLELADRDTGRRIYNELRRFTVLLEKKYQFESK